jgi:CubicO group peptidase (beta-lactamase class C family)
MGFNATLRDWGRLGLLWANLGAYEGKQIISSSYVAEAKAWNPSGYGYQVWLLGKDTGQVAFLGVRGQTIFVDTASKLVMVITAIREQEYTANTAYDKERTAIWNHLLSHYKN